MNPTTTAPAAAASLAAARATVSRETAAGSLRDPATEG